MDVRRGVAPSAVCVDGHCGSLINSNGFVTIRHGRGFERTWTRPRVELKQNDSFCREPAAKQQKWFVLMADGRHGFGFRLHAKLLNSTQSGLLSCQR